MPIFPKGSTVRFTAKMVADLAAQQPDAIAAAREFADMRMTVQNEPRLGRINVTYVKHGAPQFRTFSARNLQAA